MIKIKEKGDYSKITNYLNRIKKINDSIDLDKYGQRGVEALMSNTPKDTGLTSRSWYYNIEKRQDSTIINFYNSNIQNGIPIAIILQYGHSTKNGGWVEGIDYINPSLQSIFKDLADSAWKEVTRK